MEIEIIKYLQSASNPFFDVVFKVVSYLGSYTGFIIAILSMLIVAIVKTCKKQDARNLWIFIVVFGLTYGVATGANFILKIIIDRPRPFEVDPTILNWLPTVGQSMPSGHMVSVTVIAIFMFVWVKNYWFGGALAIFVAMVAISRMYLGQHFISDLAVGLVLGAIFALIGILVYNKLTRRRHENR